MGQSSPWRRQQPGGEWSTVFSSVGCFKSWGPLLLLGGLFLLTIFSVISGTRAGATRVLSLVRTRAVSCFQKNHEVQSQLRNVKKLYAADHAFAALVSDGSVVSWGSPDLGGDSNKVQDQLHDVEEIYATEGAFAALRHDRSVVSWGHPEYGGDSRNLQDHLKEVEHVYPSNLAFFARVRAGHFIAWGCPKYNLRGVSQLQDAVEISASNAAWAALLKNGQVATWGHPEHGGDSQEVQESAWAGIV